MESRSENMAGNFVSGFLLNSGPWRCLKLVREVQSQPLVMTIVEMSRSENVECFWVKDDRFNPELRSLSLKMTPILFFDILAFNISYYEK
jgi:hypothetical protein